MLVVTTTHLKGAYLRRNGASFSDKSTMMEYITRHGDYLLVTMIITDPVWLEEPFIQTTNYEAGPAHHAVLLPLHRERREHFESGAAFPAGQEPATWAPMRFRPAAARGGAETIYPEYRSKLKQPGVAAKLNVPSSPTQDCCPSRQPRWRDPCSAGARQRLHAGGRGRQYRRVDRARRHPAGGFRPLGDERLRSRRRCCNWPLRSPLRRRRTTAWACIARPTRSGGPVRR